MRSRLVQTRRLTFGKLPFLRRDRQVVHVFSFTKGRSSVLDPEARLLSCFHDASALPRSRNFLYVLRSLGPDEIHRLAHNGLFLPGSITRSFVPAPYRLPRRILALSDIASRCSSVICFTTGFLTLTHCRGTSYQQAIAPRSRSVLRTGSIPAFAMRLWKVGEADHTIARGSASLKTIVVSRSSRKSLS